MYMDDSKLELIIYLQSLEMLMVEEGSVDWLNVSDLDEDAETAVLVMMKMNARIDTVLESDDEVDNVRLE